jgi:hypothetical protein
MMDEFVSGSKMAVGVQPAIEACFFAVTKHISLTIPWFIT